MFPSTPILAMSDTLANTGALGADPTRLIEPHAGVAVGEPAPGGGVGQGLRGRHVQDDEIVPESVHLGEVEAHPAGKHTAVCGSRPPGADAPDAAARRQTLTTRSPVI